MRSDRRRFCFRLRGTLAGSGLRRILEDLHQAARRGLVGYAPRCAPKLLLVLGFYSGEVFTGRLINTNTRREIEPPTSSGC